MSFVYKDVTVTLDNYKSIFSDCTADVLDEIRLAILDDTQIGYVIKNCLHDSYKLGQLRMAFREFIPLNYISLAMTGKTIYTMRCLFTAGMDASSLLRYIKRADTNKISMNLLVDSCTFEVLADYVYLGTDITKLDFERIPTKLVSTICRALKLGYPMWLIINYENYSIERLEAIIRCMQLGLDVHPFLEDSWNIEQINVLINFSQCVDLNEFMQYVTPKFGKDVLCALLRVAEGKFPYQNLCARDIDGYCLYNSYQIDEIRSAMIDGTLSEDMMTWGMSDLEIHRLHMAKLQESKTFGTAMEAVEPVLNGVIE